MAKHSKKNHSFFSFLIVLFLFSCSNQGGEVQLIQGLTEDVEIIIDKWGISHIYAKTEEDLFFAQGYSAARDRLFQLEIWRRQANGTVAEILGPKELKRDIGTRLFKFRGDMDTEMNHYHPKGKMIIESFVKGVNAYIKKTQQFPELLPPEFEILDIKPDLWTPEIVISRHQGLLGNIDQELNYGRAVATLGEQIVKDLSNFKPSDPNLSLDPSITSEMLEKDILELYNAYRRKVTFSEDQRMASIDFELNPETLEYIGSNNWIVDGDISASGYPMMANDPHRTQAIPSLRYWAHLNGPGWNVIGGGEPEIPGISIGHNGFGTWGLTVFATDGEDLLVYDLNPENLNQYRYQDNWEEMKVISETIPVKGQEEELVELRYSRHGPVTYIDSVLNKAYAVRCAWLEPGGSPYLASLRMDQAQSWEQFREACNYSHIPGENMIWADKEGNIGWQAVGIAPVRRNWSGLIPVPGDGRFEWDGYLPIIEKPNITNPENGYFASANEYLVPSDYSHMDAIGYRWSDSFRGDRAREVLGSGEKLDLKDMAQLQTDYYSKPASLLVPLLAIPHFEQYPNEISKRLLDWNFSLDPESVEAAVYVTWERILRKSIADQIIPENASRFFSNISMEKTLDLLINPNQTLGEDPESKRNELIKSTFSSAVEKMAKDFGENIDDWKYGHAGFKHIELKHSMDPMLSEEEKLMFNTSLKPRGGNSYTLNNTSGNNSQTHGASFRIIVDTGNFDEALGCNSPGQSGDPRDPHYKDLFNLWASNEYFPVYFSRKKIEANAGRKITLRPEK
jgi:penicillin amidase